MELKLSTSRINIVKSLAFQLFSDELCNFLREANIQSYDNIVIACIGTDKYMGDCLGPLIGHKLNSSILDKHIHVFGTLETPMHAVSLRNMLKEIKNIPNAYIIAIDACVGSEKSLGDILIEAAPLKPGAGVKKKLPEVGDLSIKGILVANTSEDDDVYFSLKNDVRMFHVMRMADIIAHGIVYALWTTKQKKEEMV